METSEATNQLLKKKYDLHKSPEVEHAAKRTQRLTGDKVPQDPLVRIQNYLNRFHEIIDQDDSARREHALDLIKGRFHNKYVIKPSEIPQSFWDDQKRIIRERGQGADLERVDFEELKRQNTEAIIADQTSSLDKWIDYLSSPDAPYSDSLKYFTLRSVLNMSEYDKEKKAYPQRSKGTTKPFPDLNREALAYVLDAVEKKYASTSSAQAIPEGNPEFEKLLQGENFAKLYAWAVADLLPGNPTTDQIYAKAKELGLELAPAEAGVHYRLKYKDQPFDEWLHMGMKQIVGRFGDPYVFRLFRRDDGLWLSSSLARPVSRWSPGNEFVFVLSPPAGEASKSEPKKLGLLDRFLKR